MIFRWLRERRLERSPGVQEARRALTQSDVDLREADKLHDEASARCYESQSLAERLRVIRLNNHITPSLFPPDRNTE